ncbi:MAG: GNAT family N-acetyltransferase [Tenericutes bacterium HGW-Tenericutes-2]|jgi:diamine N-acetyltransferase|nr:MAG: GNAT family N-acetyltransferase [Tenericutes bacterium HGW-Tenericutes-2]
MNKISLQLVTHDNFTAVTKLSDTLTDDQKKCVATNVKSLAQAYLSPNDAWPRAIYLNDTPIGFIMLDLNPDDIPNNEKAYYLWRYMIAFDYQGKGYGKEVLDLIVNKCKEDQKDFLYTSCVMENDMPYQFYLKYGFIDTGVLEEDEEVLKLDISSKI